jgi:endoglucanase
MNWLLALFVLSNIFISSFGYSDENKAAYWQTQRKGTNFFNKTPTEDWFIAAKESGIQFARLCCDKWQSESRDFLLGNVDSFTAIPSADFEILKKTLDQAYRHNVKVVITLLSLPGSRWKQNNNDQDDLRIWQDEKYQIQAILFWKELAGLLKDHPAVVGYNILNEPHPERLFGIGDFREINFQRWYQTVKGSLADLNLFYKKIVSAIREVDSVTAIILDTGLYATPWAISYLNPINESGVLYSFHMYEPYAYTTRNINNEKYEYPGTIPTRLVDAEESFGEGSSTYWDEKVLQNFLEPISLWQKKFQIPPSQILVGEFGCDRTSKGVENYLASLIRIFDAHHWHWAFYSFREDCWDSMDYELGKDKLSWNYWEALEQRASLDSFRYIDPLFSILKNGLKTPE